MKNRQCSVVAVALLAHGVSAVVLGAQSTYTPYAFTNFAGNPGVAGTNDGTGSAARFRDPGSVALDSTGNLYVADFENHTVRKITPAGAVTTLAGLAGKSGSADGTGSAARFYGPATLDVDSNGNVYVTDYFNHTIRKVTSEGIVTTLAGAPGFPGATDGSPDVARFRNPIGIGVDSAANVYVGDSGNHTIRRITPGDNVATLAGSAGHPGGVDGTGNAARFNDPHHVRVDTAGNVYVADTGNHTIRKITPAGVVSTVAGSAGRSGSVDGPANLARFNGPHGVFVSTNGTVYVADSFSFTIRRITSAGVVTTLAGLAGRTGTLDGIGSGARFNEFWSVAVDKYNNLYVADSLNHRITKGTPLLQFEPTLGGLANSNGFFQVRLMGPFGSNAVLESSADLQAWTPLQTNTLPPDSFELSLPLDINQNRFFRARLAP